MHFGRQSSRSTSIQDQLIHCKTSVILFAHIQFNSSLLIIIKYLIMLPGQDSSII